MLWILSLDRRLRREDGSGRRRRKPRKFSRCAWWMVYILKMESGAARMSRRRCADGCRDRDEMMNQHSSEGCPTRRFVIPA